jgi:uncharacterized OsmC-like protein
MSAQDIAEALKRVETALQKRPAMGLQDDAPATSRWDGGLRFVASHANGATVTSDMPTPLGGGGEAVSPGWYFRAGLASCTASVIAMTAAAEGIELTALELRASSRSDTRGALGMSEADGGAISAGPCDVQFHVRIAARNASADRLRAIVQTGCARSPAVCALAAPPALHIDIEAAAATAIEASGA